MLRSKHRQAFLTGKVSDAFRPTAPGSHLGVVLPNAFGYGAAAPTFRAAATATAATTTVALPAGSIAGDTVVVWVNEISNYNNGNITPQSGSTVIAVKSATAWRCTLWLRQLNSTDISNGNVSWTRPSSNQFDVIICSYYVPGGQALVAYTGTIADIAANPSNAQLSPAITPDRLALYISGGAGYPGNQGITVTAPATRRAIVNDTSNQVTIFLADHQVDATTGSTQDTWAYGANGNNHNGIFSCILADH